MTFWTAIGRQLRDPTGAAGSAMGRMMRLVNARPNVLAVGALAPQPGDHVLELGCGPGHALELMTPLVGQGVVHAVDQSAVMLAQARARNRAAFRSGRIRLYCAKFDALPIQSRSLDKILAVNVAYFWRDAEPVLAEIRRVLRPGGVLAIYVTDRSAMQRWKFAEPATHRLFDRAALARLLRRGGFENESVSVAPIRLPWNIPGLIGLVTKRGDRCPATARARGPGDMNRG